MGQALQEIIIPEEGSEHSLLLDDAGVNVWIDKYKDVFSDFDTRPFATRKLSNDFLTEITKMVRENGSASQVELNFNILDDKYDPEVESIIKGHLKKHFTANRKTVLDDIKKTFRIGYFLTALGFILILTLAYVASLAKGAFFLNSLPVVVEPLAWFMTWTGLDHIFKNYGSNKKTDVNVRMLEAKITFMCMGDMSALLGEVEEAPKPRKVIPAGNNLRIA